MSWRATSTPLACKQADAIARIGIDEKAFRKGHRYLTIVNDVDRGIVEFIALTTAPLPRPP